MQEILFITGLVFSLISMICTAFTAIQLVKIKKQSPEKENQKQLEKLEQVLVGELRYLDGRFRQLSDQSDQQLTHFRRSVDSRLQEMQTIVDEKLENRLDRSFSQVSARLEQVYRGLGEMQGLAASVGDLKKVLSNVKTRGMLGEVQLGMILKDILAPGQYQTNVCVKPGSRETVEFAVILPGGEEGNIFLPIDAKFPADACTHLVNALESGGTEEIASARAQLSQRLRSFAKDIRDKYINPPQTTDFAILFLPFESLYAQALQLGMLERLQRDYKVTLAGPTTMAALLNSLQMGFQTLAIQQRSSEVWEVLGAVKTEFSHFEATLGATRQRLEQASGELDRLVGVRTRMIQRKLSRVSELEPTRTAELLETEENDRHVN